jgi:Putative peptidoglycan-binding domain-containing protein
MAKGYLIINVYLESVAQPVEKATVTVTGENYKKEFTTNSEGKTELIELDAPDIDFSLTPQHFVRPYSLYDVKVEKPGLNMTLVKNVEILPNETSLQNIFIKKTPVSINITELPPHVLWGDYEPKIPEDPIKEEAEEVRVLPKVIIPEYIIVHDGIPTNTTATNYVVPFIDYIKNVASSEIYSTWNKEAIKANVHAIVSFTLNRVFTEWYRGRGYSFTITSSSAYDQTYTHNRTIFQSISNIVDEYFRYYIRLTGLKQPFLAQYNDGVKTNNPNWLNQWGSQDLATKGYTALQILRYYYTNNLNLYTEEEMIGLPTSFPGYNLNLNSCGEYVQKMQIELNRIRGNYPGIPAISPADGKFEESTKNAVIAFQNAFNLPSNGIVDFATWFKISYVFGAVAKLAAGL